MTHKHGDSITVALKEWAVVCDLLAEGECHFVLRKGGIHEDRGPGRFELEHARFAFYPAWEHQWPGGVREAWADRVRVFDREPKEVGLTAIGSPAAVRTMPACVFTS